MQRVVVWLRAGLVLALFGALLGLVPAAALAQLADLCFPQTGQCIGGRIRLFWQRQGGLPVFGYPIGPEQATQVEGRTIQLQWFERNRLELHPEGVLLGRLGADLLAQQGRDWRGFPPGAQQGDCVRFAETGRSVCGAFLAAWRTRGLDLDGRAGVSGVESLALWGLPLSDPQIETLSDGRSYSVQWFERARFEDHGSTGVLFGLLGRELQGTIAPPAAPPPVAGVPPADAVAARLRVPDGFVVRGFAEGLASPRLMTIGPDGALYVAERDAGRVVRLPDRDGDGRADGRETVVANLTAPHNMEWIGSCLYVAENDEVSRHCDPDGDGSLDQHTRIVELPTGGGHSSRTLHAGPDGKLYVAAGSTCNVCVERDARRATIMRFNLDGSIPADNPFANDPNPLRRAVWAEGLRNSIDFLFMPDGQLWANHNGRDNMISAQAKNDRPLEEIAIAVQAGRHHGWPYCTSERVDGNTEPGVGAFVERRDPSPDVPVPPAGWSCENAIPALATAVAHSAPIGIVRYAGTAFPEEYRGDLFVALHGSWNRTPPAPCRVVRVRVDDGRPVAVEEFLTGFQSSAGQSCGDAWGRPAGIVTGADGALYVSDDANGRVYRITASDK